MPPAMPSPARRWRHPSMGPAASSSTSPADKDANIIFGTVIDEKMSGEIKITVVATGFVTGTETSREIDEQYSRPAPVEEVPAYKGFAPSTLDIPAFLRGRRYPLARSAPFPLLALVYIQDHNMWDTDLR